MVKKIRGQYARVPEHSSWLKVKDIFSAVEAEDNELTFRCCRSTFYNCNFGKQTAQGKNKIKCPVTSKVSADVSDNSHINCCDGSGQTTTRSLTAVGQVSSSTYLAKFQCKTLFQERASGDLSIHKYISVPSFSRKFTQSLPFPSDLQSYTRQAVEHGL
ncbi:hypothetical protein RRG08_011840 [Elysia crispata]|uniref:Uncharacterized protein n=1 Tax=Elysia crispata TaxID=231223 RepID=A0AAE1AU64_9GAST|nr:hypothetical protein RRG08_011840 [Elysia crispata]